MKFLKICKASIDALAAAFQAAMEAALANVNVEVDTIMVTKNEVCLKADGYEGIGWCVTLHLEDGTAVTRYFALNDHNQETPLENVVMESECCFSSEEDSMMRYYLPDVADREETKFNLDDPTFTNAYGSVSPAGWSAADLAAALNADAANAVPPTVPSGIDYSATTWADGSDANGDYVEVTAGDEPTTLDLVSINVSIPVS